MDNDLERSVRLLEDCLSTPSKSLLQSSSGRARLNKERELNLTGTFDLDEGWKLGLNRSYDKALSGLLESNKSITGSVIRAGDPWKTTADKLFVEFSEPLQCYSNGNEVFDLVSDLARICSDTLKVIESLKSRVSVKLPVEEPWLENERNTWRLIYVLYQDRLNFQSPDNNEEVCYSPLSEKLRVEQLYRQEHLVRESQLVIDWLESNAAEKDDEILHFSDNTVGWENTLHQLQSAETIVFGSSRKIIKSLDPDAPHFQKLFLHDLDMEDDIRLCKRVFTEIRCGKFAEAQKLCCHCGHPWRAALLEGWKLYHDPNIHGKPPRTDEYEMEDNIPSADTISAVEGNSNRDIWKIMAHRYCQQEYLNIYEKASLAAYCGDLQALLQVCKSWEDNLWAYMKVMVDIRVESEIRDWVHKCYQPLPDQYWEQKMSLNEIFECLQSSNNSRVRTEANDPNHHIQKLIILDQVPQLFEYLEELITDDAINTQFVRFLAHLVLFFDQIGLGHKRSVTEKVLEVYITRLTQMKETRLVAFYVGKLERQKQIEIYASYLEDVVDEQERKEGLCFGEECGLDVLATTKRIVENIRNKSEEVGFLRDLEHKVTNLDLFKISALDWLLFYDSQRLDALFASNAIIFHFITLGKLDAAQSAFDKIPADSVDKVMLEEEVPDYVDNVVNEHLCYTAYLQAHAAFNNWFRLFNSAPISPEKLSENAQFTEKVAHQHKVTSYNAEIQRWKLSVTNSAKTTKTALYNVLLFPKGWLVGAKDADYLRSVCIPEIVLLLYSVLFEMGLHQETVQLADVLAAETHALYKVYSKDKLAQILIKLTESSLALLNERKDPWGY